MDAVHGPCALQHFCLNTKGRCPQIPGCSHLSFYEAEEIPLNTTHHHQTIVNKYCIEKNNTEEEEF